jgi:hypothetical protein
MTTRGRKSERTRRIAALNDRLRKEPSDAALGKTYFSAGMAALGEDFKAKVLAKVAGMTAKDFKKGNDPYGERDFNSFSVDGKLCLFKIDYFAKHDLRRPSDDPADTARTTRVLTLMLTDDY